jgi:A/G-specific adenine glycosylase
MASSIQQEFTNPLLLWHEQYGRQDLPWKHPPTPYRVWISEIMLQQTQVKTVIPYFLRFIERFPDLYSLAHASEDEVLALWSGLGYYSRGRYLHQTAKIIQLKYQGQFPTETQTLQQLPGIGPSTAAAIRSQAFNLPATIMDGNVKRVLSRYFLIKGIGAETTKQLWEHAQCCISKERPADYTQAIMDLGATCCTARNPQCSICPLEKTCRAKAHQLIADFPTKKDKKSLPENHQQFLLLYRSDKTIYLEKRPAKGLWGSLWCTPCIEMDSDPIAYVKQQGYLDTDPPTPLMTFKHTFTHFHLHISAMAIQINTPEPYAFSASGHWFSHAESIKLGLPKPIRDIIGRFYLNCS